MAGLFFIFSVCIMTALGRLAPASGIAAMQSINVTILNGIFLTVFMGTALLCLALIAAWFARLGAVRRDVRAGRQPALSRRHHRRDDVLQRADEQRAGGGAARTAAKAPPCGRTTSSTGRCGTMSARLPASARSALLIDRFPRLSGRARDPFRGSPVLKLLPAQHRVSVTAWATP